MASATMQGNCSAFQFHLSSMLRRLFAAFPELLVFYFAAPARRHYVEAEIGNSWVGYIAKTHAQAAKSLTNVELVAVVNHRKNRWAHSPSSLTFRASTRRSTT